MCPIITIQRHTIITHTREVVVVELGDNRYLPVNITTVVTVAVVVVVLPTTSTPEANHMDMPVGRTRYNKRTTPPEAPEVEPLNSEVAVSEAIMAADHPVEVVPVVQETREATEITRTRCQRQRPPP